MNETLINLLQQNRTEKLVGGCEGGEEEDTFRYGCQ